MSTTPSTPEEDDSLIDSLGDTVDVLLSEENPPEPEDKWERRQRLMDSWTAIILASAAVATAWATFQASQWAGAQSDAQSVSAIERSDANRAQSQATSDEIQNSQMWLSWLAAEANGQKERAAFFRERFTPELAVAQKAWLGSVPTDAQGNPASIPPGTPMDLPVYVVPAHAKADQLSAQAEESLKTADQAASNSTRFVLLAVLMALVLFFASIATKFSAPKLQVLLVLLSILLLAFTVLRLVFLPQLL